MSPAEQQTQTAAPRQRRIVIGACHPPLVYRRKPASDFHLLLRALRKQAGFKQVAVANKAGISLDTYRAVESGKRPPWRDPDVLDRIARLLGLAEAISDNLFRSAGLLPSDVLAVVATFDLLRLGRQQIRPVRVPPESMPQQQGSTATTGSKPRDGRRPFAEPHEQRRNGSQDAASSKATRRSFGRGHTRRSEPL